MVAFNFKGLMAPVFTPFKDDREQSVNYDFIEPYAEFLKAKRIHGVLVNGTSGEGMLMTVEERKKTCEIWQKACKKHNITLMVQIGGAPYPDVVELAKHAQSLQVDSILCLPELYFKPKTEAKLVEYLRNISKYCPTTPLLYYHIPMFTDVNLNMPKFLDLAEKEIPNFCGIKYTNGDLDQGAACLKPNRSIFLGADTILCGALALGFESSIMTTLNICPELSIEIMELFEAGKMAEALKVQQVLNNEIKKILVNGDGNWVTSMKIAFNDGMKFKMGKTRKPL